MPITAKDLAEGLELETCKVLAVAKELGLSARGPNTSLTDLASETIQGYFLRQAAMDSRKDSDETGPQCADQTPASEPARKRPATMHNGTHNLHLNVNVSGDRAVAFLRQIESGKITLSFSVTLQEKASAGSVFDLVPVLTKGTGSELLRKQVDDKTGKVLLAAYRAASAEEEGGWVTLAEFGSVLKKLHPSFRPTQYGFPGLSELIQSCDEVFETKSDTSFAVPVIFVRPRDASSGHNRAVRQPPPAEITSARERGRILVLKGTYGFVKPDNGDQNLFFHASDVVEPCIGKLTVGDIVTYFSGKNKRSACAKSVRKEREG